MFNFGFDMLINNLLLDFVLDNYIKTNLFPISVWNQFDNDGSRTNNTVEGYNLKLNNFLSSHPSIWIFIRKI
jgi:hypothetical protein